MTTRYHFYFLPFWLLSTILPPPFVPFLPFPWSYLFRCLTVPLWHANETRLIKHLYFTPIIHEICMHALWEVADSAWEDDA